MNKRPSLQFYPADWLKDPDLQICSMTTIGIWINLMCRMWETKEEGILHGTAEELALLVGARPAEFERFLGEAETHLFADVTKCNSVVTIKCRRMNRVFLEREGAKTRMRRYRGKPSDADVTAPSSTSSSSSTTKSIYMDFVLLSGEEHGKLLKKFGESLLKEKIEDLNNYLGQTGKRYKSHYHTILSWCRKDEKLSGAATEPAICIVDHMPAMGYQVDRKGKKVYLCDECKAGWAASGRMGGWGKLPPAAIEKTVLEGKAKGARK